MLKFENFNLEWPKSEEFCIFRGGMVHLGNFFKTWGNQSTVVTKIFCIKPCSPIFWKNLLSYIFRLRQYHPWASSKIAQVMAILVHDPPLTPLNPHLWRPWFQCLVKSYYHTKFWASSSKIDRVMAILVHDPPLTPLNPPPLTPLTSLYLSA